MKKAYILMFALVFALLLSGVSYAATDLFSLEPVGTVVIDSNSVLKGVRTDAEELGSGIGSADASDTITAADTGRIFVLEAGTYVTLTLPAAADGLRYTFVMASQGETTTKISLIPVVTDHIRYTTMQTGKTLVAAEQATGASISILGDSDGFWAVISVNGTWATAT